MLFEVLALAGGLIAPLAFSPFDWPYLALVSLALLFISWLAATPAQAAARGYLFGLGQFGFGVSWVYLSMHDFGGASVAEASLLTLLFVLFLALYPAVAGWLAVRLSPARLGRSRVSVYAAVWVLMEWFRGWFLSGFPWLQFGSSQTDTPLGNGIAPVAGVFGVGLAVAVLAALAILLIDRRHWRRRGALVGMASIFVVGAWSERVDWTQAAGEPFKVALLQGNIAQDQKWVPAFQRATLENYIAQTREHWDARLVIWPETAVPAFFHQVKDTWLKELKAEAATHGTDLLIGMPVLNPESGQYYNALVGLSRGDMYFKRHLVPFGEFLPLRPVLGFVLEWLQIPLADFSRGAEDQPLLTAAGHPLVASVCYEDIFGHESRAGLPEATYLVNVTNDAWFGTSIAPYQHVQMARMRALESGRYLLRATNTGVTAVIGPNGTIVAQAPLFERTAVSAEIQPRQGATPYVHYGDWPVVSLLLVFLLAIQGLRRIP
ncbi:apolipoprotein N-acyltransferase [Methylococcus sp. EFPC2]|uniref:apolipoprotein N-acyltransferase n=1 Tax=Methylococcus sp. EFPC2 TaxID=2812648 RepID=UPI001F084B55|nr:apolipoprotein N-acyltransferase [Methylococcus sp. EFPC2]